MPQLTSADLAKVLRGGANRVREDHERLSRLDAATGDGDHGVTMKRVADAITGAVASQPLPDPGPLLEQVGWNVMSVDGGSTSPLWGSFFLGISEAVAGRATLDGPGLAAAFQAGVARLRAQTAAQPGDKTMIDALVPALDAMLDGAKAGKDPSSLLADAAAAAQQGAEATAAMQARFGRARNLGLRSIGHVDPGAASIALLLAGFRDALA